MQTSHSVHERRTTPIFPAIPRQLSSLDSINENIPKYIESMSSIQESVDSFIVVLSQQTYSSFNEDIHIGSITYNHLSTESLIRAFSKKSIYFDGDSQIGRWIVYLRLILNALCHRDNPSSFVIERYPFQHRTSILHADENIIYSLDDVIPNNFDHSLVLPVAPYEFAISQRFYRLQLEQFVSASEHKSSGRCDLELMTNLHWATDVDSANFYGDGLEVMQQIKEDNLWRAGTLGVGERVPSASSNGSEFDFDFRFTQKMDAMVFNFASMHLTHLYPIRPFEAHAIETLMNLESHFNKTVEVALRRNAKCLVFRTNNAICSHLFHSEYKEWTTFYENIRAFYDDPNYKVNAESDILREEVLIQQCVQWNYKEELEEKYGNYKDRVREFCSFKYTLTRFGIQTINNIIKKYVYRMQERLFDKTGLKLILFDSWKLYEDRCEYAPDGRHYTPLFPVQTMAISNIIDKWC